MRPEILKMICCPDCRKDMEVVSFSSVDDCGICDGILLCSECMRRYPIVNHVPVLLLFQTPLHREFDRQFKDRLQELTRYSGPTDRPSAGEETVQQTFTEEWALISVKEGELNFTYTMDDLVNLNRKVWLKWMNNNSQDVSKVLVVGCGAGREAIALGKVMPGASIFAIDINLALIRNGKQLAQHPRLHAIVCSLRHPPFREGSFDLVYSQGVLHHNASTLAAFRAITPFVRVEGHLFVWIYGLDDHLLWKGLIGILTRLTAVIETILRPIISRLPSRLREGIFLILGVLLHPLVLTRVRHRDSWRLINTIHGLRDWLSPRYAHVHSYNEVIEWFEREEFRVVDVQSPAAYRDLFKKQLWGVGMTGQRMARAKSEAQ